MKRFFTFLFIAAVSAAPGCSNSNTSTETKSDTMTTVGTDTTARHDSTTGNPDAMSDPH